MAFAVSAMQPLPRPRSAARRGYTDAWCSPKIECDYDCLMPFDDRPTRLVPLTTYLLSQTAKLAKRELDHRLSARGLRLRHMSVMASLDDGEASQLDLARRLHLDPSDVTATVDELETDSFTKRRRAPDTRT